MSDITNVLVQKLLEFFAERPENFTVNHAVDNVNKFTTVPFIANKNQMGAIHIVSPSYICIRYIDENQTEVTDSFKSMIDTMFFLQEQFVYNDYVAAKTIPRKKFGRDSGSQYDFAKIPL